MDHLDPDGKDRIVEERHVENVDDNSLVLTEPVESEPFVLPHQEREAGQSLIQTIVMVIGGIILVVLLVLFARWIYHKVHNSSAADTSSGTIQIPEPSNSPSTQPGTNSSSGSSNSTSTPAPAQNNTITNTGPGNVAAIFAASTLAAAGLHYIISIRRFNKTGL